MAEDSNIVQITSLRLNELVPFENHPFKLYANERMDDLSASIKEIGVITPIIVRTTNKKNIYEIISGHNRVNASKRAGKKDIPAVIFSDMPDDVAFAYVIESNVLQRSFSEMSHTEKAAVLTLHHSKLFSPGKRTDILNELKRLESIGNDFVESDVTFSHSDKRLRSNEIVGEKYSLSPAQVSRYLRIQYLTHFLKELLDYDKLGFIAAVELSFLPEKEQNMVADYMIKNRLSVDGRKAKTLRIFFAAGELNEDKIYKILSGTLIPKPPRKHTISISPTVYSRFFTPKQKPHEVEKIITAALEKYFSE